MILDAALLRSGRFDRHILVDRPDLLGREAILKTHTKDIKLAEGIDLKTLAARTPGMAGADLANVANKAALQEKVKLFYRGIPGFYITPTNLPRQRGKNLTSFPWRGGLRKGGNLHLSAMSHVGILLP